MPDRLPPAVRVPDVLGPIEGWRGWAVILDEGRARLGSLFGDDGPWPPGMATRARCLVGGGRHSAPQQHCGCGIYALKDASFRSRGVLFGVAAIGKVALWGRVVEHEAGHRAELAYPLRVRLSCGRCLARGRMRPPDVGRVGPGGLVMVACRAHATTMPAGPDVSVAELERALVDAYGIEPLSAQDLDEVESAPPPPAVTIPREPVEAVRGRRGIVGRLLGWATLAVVLWRLPDLLAPQIEQERPPSAPVTPVVGGTPLPGEVRPEPSSERPSRPREPARQLMFVCAALTSPVDVELRGCGRQSATLFGTIWAPAAPRSMCDRSEGFTIKARFSVCWFSIDEPIAGRRLYLRDVLWREVRRGG